MQLYTSGFNAWDQLNFGKGEQKSEEQPSDYRDFVEVFADDRIDKVWASLTAVRVESSNGTHVAGCLEDWCDTQSDIFSPTVAVTGAYWLAAYGRNTKTVHQYQSPNHYLEGQIHDIFHDLGNIIQITSYETGFVALSDEGKVWSWGDGRFSACLGREVTDEFPANAPGLVTDLVELPTGKITKIAAGGYLVMALTEGNDLYAWGGHPGLPAMFDGLSESPTPVDVDDSDVVDFSVGSSHAALLSKDGHLFAVGDNTNGQLGLPRKEKLHSWTRVPIALGPSKTIISVVCGPRNTLFVVNSKSTQAAS
ncbi:hypothetical protein PFICI_11250 [Pestalotiopsis fici W106-1]|uniref:Uncharacterized protein n=1 Tax=Pestalotiopsis fici (strain W106-1 / CGMCC3.15140) TaxID=1229662 RepID=W3WWX9_PESFW|nr:uncharacterized protein PFICI_11250 [Pestalotiopsis fici W106-1]ETS77376.1 hypothetical protein PFICI_11250 [Pestalotiopsis fici W106-1]